MIRAGQTWINPGRKGSYARLEKIIDGYVYYEYTIMPTKTCSKHKWYNPSGNKDETEEIFEKLLISEGFVLMEDEEEII
jgi:hypothetical protein